MSIGDNCPKSQNSDTHSSEISPLFNANLDRVSYDLRIASHLSSVMAIAEVFLGVSFDPALKSVAVRTGQYLLIRAKTV